MSSSVSLPSGTRCLKHCANQSSIGALMKPPDNCLCLAESPKVTISNMSSDCDQSWSQKMPGPTGSFLPSQQAGWALFSTPENCLDMSDSANFHSNSPGRCDLFRLETCRFRE